MASSTRPRIRASAMPCPNCGYDLRGHASITRCSECGERVAVDATINQTLRWVDLKLIDLWSIAIVQGAGCAAGGLSLLAIRNGHFTALLLGLMAELAICIATLWFIALSPGILLRLRSPIIKSLETQAIRHLRRLWVLDAALIALPPLVYFLL